MIRSEDASLDNSELLIWREVVDDEEEQDDMWPLV